MCFMRVAMVFFTVFVAGGLLLPYFYHWSLHNTHFNQIIELKFSLQFAKARVNGEMINFKVHIWHYEWFVLQLTRDLLVLQPINSV